MKKTNETSGTSYQGEIRVDYDTLVKVFGEPHFTGGYTCKTDAEWGFDFDGVIATIYNWKNGKNWIGDDGLETKDIEYWHIGGFNDEAVRVVEKALSINSRKKDKKYFERIITSQYGLEEKMKKLLIKE